MLKETVCVYHRTAAESAKAILRDGFKDATGYYLTDREHAGVWLSDRPLDANEDVNADTLLEVLIDPDSLADYEWVEEGKPYREWLVPAVILNRCIKAIRVLEVESL